MIGCTLILAALAAAKDTTYGRIDGDVVVGFGAGVTIAPRGLLGTLDVRARYLDSAGVFVTYEEGFGGPAEPARVLAFGLEVRPFFLARWLKDAELGVPFVDLLIDSFALEMGAAVLQPAHGTFADRVALQAGVGIEVPLFAKATGPWIGLHAGGRLSDRGLAYEVMIPLEQSMYLTMTLSWHQVIGTHAVDVGDVKR
jgi:hypothetical protein